MAMNKERAQEILKEVLEENQKKQQVIITQSNNDVLIPHNGVTSKTADFIDSLSNNQTMKEVINEISDKAVDLINRIDNV